MHRIFLLRARSDLARKNTARLANCIQKIVPPLAAWCRPYFARSAPVNVLLTCPNTCDSTSSGATPVCGSGLQRFHFRALPLALQASVLLMCIPERCLSAAICLVGALAKTDSYEEIQTYKAQGAERRTANNSSGIGSRTAD
jgi:hypothetical protein